MAVEARETHPRLLARGQATHRRHARPRFSAGADNVPGDGLNGKTVQLKFDVGVTLLATGLWGTIDCLLVVTNSCATSDVLRLQFQLFHCHYDYHEPLPPKIVFPAPPPFIAPKASASFRSVSSARQLLKSWLASSSCAWAKPHSTVSFPRHHRQCSYHHRCRLG